MIQYKLGIPEALRTNAAKLYDEAFGAKFALAIRNRNRRLALLTAALNARHGIAALEDGQLVGLTGFYSAEGSLTEGITFQTLIAHVGLIGGLWAALIFSLYERQPTAGELLMDGIAVSATMRGRGVGTGLLHELMTYARDHGYQTIRLDVIDTNPGARRLYERNGFIATELEDFGYLRWLLGFGASTTMKYDL